MTRGRIIYFDKEHRATSIEFNGDMYPEGHGEEVIKNFRHIDSFHKYTQFVERFDRRNFGYLEGLYREIDPELITQLDSGLAFSVRENWTDYLYIINNTGSDLHIFDKNMTHTISDKALGIVNYQTFRKEIHPEDTTMTKEDFTSIITKLRDTTDFVDKVDALFRENCEKVECEFGSGSALHISHEPIVIDLLQRIMHDEAEDISYFIYELDYGRLYEPGMVIDEDGTHIDFSTAEKLYDYLKDNF